MSSFKKLVIIMDKKLIVVIIIISLASVVFGMMVQHMISDVPVNRIKGPPADSITVEARETINPPGMKSPPMNQESYEAPVDITFTPTQTPIPVIRNTLGPKIGLTQNIIEEATSSSGAIVEYDNPTAYDSIDGALETNCSPASGWTFPMGTAEVVCRVTDSDGNREISLFYVLIRDTTAPEIEDVPNIVKEGDSAAGTIVKYNNPIAYDAVDQTVATDCSPKSSSIFPIGETIVTCTAADQIGNRKFSSFGVLVKDTTAPVIALLGINPVAITVGSPYDDAGATALDGINGNITANITTANHVNEDFVGSYTVVYDIADTAGNRAQASRTVNILPLRASLPAANKTIINESVTSDMVLLDIARTIAKKLIVVNARESITPGEHIIGSLSELLKGLAATTATNETAQEIVDQQTLTLNEDVNVYNLAIVPEPVNNLSELSETLVPKLVVNATNAT